MTENILDQLEKQKKEILESVNSLLERLIILKPAVENAKTLQELETATNNLKEISKIRQVSVLLDKHVSDLYKINDRIQ